MRQMRFSNYRPSAALRQAIAAWSAGLATPDQTAGEPAKENGRGLGPGQLGARREEEDGLRRTRNSPGAGGGSARGKSAELGKKGE